MSSKPTFPKLSNLLILVILVLVSFTLAYRFFDAKDINLFVDSFNKVMIGLAALITAYFGTNFISEEYERRRLIDRYSKQYPLSDFPKKLKIIRKRPTSGTLFLLEVEKNTIHHVMNMKTMTDLGWYLIDPEVPNSDWSSFIQGEPIKTRGELGE